MKKRSVFPLFSLLTLVGLGFLVFLWFQSVLVPIFRKEAEQNVYSALLANGNYQVAKYTTSTNFQESTFIEGTSNPSISGEAAQYILSQFPGLQKDTLDDYLAINKQVYRIDNYLLLNSNDIVVEPYEPRAGEGYAWVAFSRVGFDLYLTQALVLVQRCYLDSCSYNSGDLILLEKHKGKWTIEDRLFLFLVEPGA